MVSAGAGAGFGPRRQDAAGGTSTASASSTRAFVLNRMFLLQIVEVADDAAEYAVHELVAFSFAVEL